MKKHQELEQDYPIKFARGYEEGAEDDMDEDPLSANSENSRRIEGGFEDCSKMETSQQIQARAQYFNGEKLSEAESKLLKHSIFQCELTIALRRHESNYIKKYGLTLIKDVCAKHATHFSIYNLTLTFRGNGMNSLSALYKQINTELISEITAIDIKEEFKIFDLMKKKVNGKKSICEKIQDKWRVTIYYSRKRIWIVGLGINSSSGQKELITLDFISKTVLEDKIFKRIDTETLLFLQDIAVGELKCLGRARGKMEKTWR